MRSSSNNKLFVICNFSSAQAFLTWYAFKEQGFQSTQLFDHWNETVYDVGGDNDYLVIGPYEFLLMDAVRK
jgi:hypothetical protein